MNPADRSTTILVSGCSTGIGLACAEGLRRRGYRVFAGARKPADVEALSERGLEALRLDMDDSHSIAEAVETVLEHTGGRLDALFNNAGFGQPGAVEDLSRDAIRAQFETNLFGLMELTNRVLPTMRAQGHGRIVQNSSVLGLVSLRWRGAYNASKHALEALTDTLRLELYGSGIHIALIEPGPIESRFRAHALEAFDRHIDAAASPHRERYRAIRERLDTPAPTAPFTLGPEAVLDKLIHALESRRPRARYYVTFPTYLFATLKRLLPRPMLDMLLRRVE